MYACIYKDVANETMITYNIQLLFILSECV